MTTPRNRATIAQEREAPAAEPSGEEEIPDGLYRSRAYREWRQEMRQKAEELRPTVVSRLAAKRAGAPPRGAAPLDTSRISFSRKEQTGTSCSIGAESDADAPVFADDLGAHTFRHQVAKHLDRPWPERARSLRSCGEAGTRCDCGTCGSPHLLPYRCGARSCPTCAPAAGAIVGAKIATRVDRAFDALEIDTRWEGQPISYKNKTRRRSMNLFKPRRKSWRIVTLTTRTLGNSIEERYNPKELRKRTHLVRRAIGPFWRSTSWGTRVNDISATTGRATKRARRDTVYICGMEVSPGGTLLPDGTYSLGGVVHVHIAVYGEYIADWYLAKLWKAACPIGGYIDVRSMKSDDAGDFRKALREVLKYVTKNDHQGGDRASRAAAIEYAFKHIRRIEMGGALRLVPAVTREEVVTRGQTCTACGDAGTWRWEGMRSKTYVRTNKGFGALTIGDVLDVDVLRKAARFLERAIGNGRSEWIRDVDESPGGEKFGGAAPAWMNDPDEWETRE